MSGQNTKLNGLALQSARRQKRLAFWREQFLTIHGSSGNRQNSQTLDPERAARAARETLGGADNLAMAERTQIEELLETYRLLLARLVRAALGNTYPGEAEKNTADFKETEERLSALDRELTTKFEARRLLTNNRGSSSIVPPHL